MTKTEYRHLLISMAFSQMGRRSFDKKVLILEAADFLEACGHLDPGGVAIDVINGKHEDPEVPLAADKVNANEADPETGMMRCPFCGSEPEFDEGDMVASLACVNPACYFKPRITCNGKPADQPGDANARLAAFWNTRTFRAAVRSRP